MKIIALAIYTVAVMVLTESLDYNVPKQKENALRVIQTISIVIALLTLWWIL